MSDGADETDLQMTYSDSRPIDVDIAHGMLRDAKQILDRLEVVFFLRQGTCLGAVRDKALIPWDDDVDLGSVLGLHGLSERSIDPVVAAFKDKGYSANVESTDHYLNTVIMKSSVRMDWACYRIIDNNIFHYPGIRLPIRLFTQLKEIELIGEKFLVPNPPEEYLRIKYGPSWMTPKRLEWTKDVVEMIPETAVPGRAGKLRQMLSTHVLRWRAGRLRVLDDAGNPVAAADVVVAGLSRSKTNKQGYARFYLPCADYYALVIRHGDHEEVLYEEKMSPGATYVYRPDALSASGRIGVLSRQ
jgi:hypothetical protein